MPLTKWLALGRLRDMLPVLVRRPVGAAAAPIESIQRAVSAVLSWARSTLRAVEQYLRLAFRMARRGLYRLRRRARYRTALLVYKAEHRLSAFGAFSWSRTERAFATIVSVVLAVLLTVFLPDSGLPPTLSAMDVHLACAGIIGAALALVVTLFLLPAEKAAELFSSGILALYAGDHRNTRTFVVLALSTLVSVALGFAAAVGTDPRYALAAQFVVLGISLDLLRAFYSRALAHLVPETALHLVAQACSRYIQTVRRQVAREAHIYSLAHPAIENSPTLKWRIYAARNVAEPLRRWVSQLEEVAQKAIRRSDTHAAKTTIRTLALMGTEYAESRRDSFVLVPEWAGPIPVGVSDVRDVLNPILESLRNLCEIAAKYPDEAIVVTCIDALEALARSGLSMVHDDNGRQTAPLAFSTTFYLDVCAKKAIAAGMDDAQLALARTIGRVLSDTCEAIDTRDVEQTSIDTLFRIAVSSYPRRATVPGFEAVKTMLRATHRQVQERGFDDVGLMPDVLKRLEGLVPFEVQLEKLGERRMQTFPAYSIAFESSIPALLSAVADKIQAVDPEKNWIDPFHDFNEASEVTVMHYRNLADNVDFEGTLLERWVLDSLITCTDAHLGILTNPPAGSEAFLDGLESKLGWFIYAPTFFFRAEKKSLDERHAADVAKGLASVGMSLLRLGLLKSARDCGDAIANIGNEVMKAKGVQPSADVFGNLELFARAADALEFQGLAVVFREWMMPAIEREAERTRYAEIIAARIEHYDKCLRGRERYIFPRDPLPILQAILNSVKATQQ